MLPSYDMFELKQFGEKSLWDLAILTVTRRPFHNQGAQGSIDARRSYFVRDRTLTRNNAITSIA